MCTLDMWKSLKSMLFCIFDAIFARIYFNSEKITVVVTCMVGVRKTVKKNRQCLINSEACINIKRIRLVLVVYLVFSCFISLCDRSIIFITDFSVVSFSRQSFSSIV